MMDKNKKKADKAVLCDSPITWAKGRLHGSNKGELWRKAYK